MVTINISVPESMAAYVRSMVDRDYGNVSELFRELLRERMARDIRSDLEFLKSTGAAPAGPTDADVEEILAVQRQVRKDRRA